MQLFDAEIKKVVYRDRYRWQLTISIPGDDEPIWMSRHLTKRRAIETQNWRLSILEAKTRRSVFDWTFTQGDGTPRAWGWLCIEGEAKSREESLDPAVTRLALATRGMPIEMSMDNLRHRLRFGKFRVSIPFKTGWGASFTERQLKEADPSVFVRWVQDDFLTAVSRKGRK